MGGKKKGGFFGGLGRIFNGKEQKYKADASAGGINDLGSQGINQINAGASELNKLYNNPNETVNNQIGIENKLMRGASEDATRRTRDLIAQRGMGGSSIGLGQEVNQNKMLSDKLAMNNASGMERLKALSQERINLGNTLLAPKLSQGPIQMTDIKKRRGGLTGEGGLLDTAAPFAGAAATAYAKGG